MALKHLIRTTSYAIPPDISCVLAKLFGATEATSGAPSRFLPIHNNDQALAWRQGLIENAEFSIDAQYYSWHSDTSGRLLIKNLIDAADRGVRVRLLLDDIHTFGVDRQIAILNHHRNIEVRLFNPFHLRWSLKLFRVFEFLWNLNRLNHRMHNKLLIVDNVVSIIGGRNIGDEYFGLKNDYNFRDLDLLVSGPSISHFSSSFDLYWNSRVSKTARRIIAFRPRRFDFIHMQKRLDKTLISKEAIVLRITKLKNKLLNDPELGDSLITADNEVFYDIPELGEDEQIKIAQKLFEISIQVEQHLTIVSAYFVPSDKLMDAIQTLVDKGIHIKVFTNSLASIDVTAAFSGYERCREQLLRLGVELFEFCAAPEYHSIYTTPAINVKRSSLHAKSMIYDNDTVYVGTLNMDPRSATLNTEIGILVNNAVLTENIYGAFMNDLAENQYWQVRLDNNDRLSWTCGEHTTRRQPARHLWQRLANWAYSKLPIRQHL